MKFTIFNEEAARIWKRVASGSSINLGEFELELYKKLLGFFQIR